MRPVKDECSFFIHFSSISDSVIVGWVLLISDSIIVGYNGSSLPQTLQVRGTLGATYIRVIEGGVQWVLIVSESVRVEYNGSSLPQTQ